MKLNYFFLLLITCCANTFAQSADEVYQFSKDIKHKIEKDTLSWKYQLGATAYSLSGYYKEALETWDKNGLRKPKITTADSIYFTKLKPVSAKDYIINQSKKEQIIIINEAHHVSIHRVFTKSILQGLYNNGFRYLALEALFDKDINTRKYPIMESGYYTKEPEFGNLIAEALKIGYTLFSYEASEGKNGTEREIEQAENIKRFRTENPNGKLLIHCGFDHVYENEHRYWGKAMAGKLKEITGINPFTIDQVPYTEKGDANFNHQLTTNNTTNHPIVLINSDDKPFGGLLEVNNTDISIIHPVTKWINGRPDWIVENRSAYQMPKDKLKGNNLLVLAYRTNEFKNGGIPADLIEINTQDSAKLNTLYLNKGKYEIVIKDENYQIIEQYEVNIK